MADAPVVLYDGACGFCRDWSRRLARWDRAGRLHLLPFQDRGELSGLPRLDDRDLERALHVVLPDGRVVAGAEGIIALLPWLPGGPPLALFARLPGVAWVADRVYAAVARRRHALGKDAEECPLR